MTLTSLRWKIRRAFLWLKWRIGQAIEFPDCHWCGCITAGWYLCTMCRTNGRTSVFVADVD